MGCHVVIVRYSFVCFGRWPNCPVCVRDDEPLDGAGGVGSGDGEDDARYRSIASCSARRHFSWFSRDSLRQASAIASAGVNAWENGRDLGGLLSESSEDILHLERTVLAVRRDARAQNVTYEDERS